MGNKPRDFQSNINKPRDFQSNTNKPNEDFQKNTNQQNREKFSNQSNKNERPDLINNPNGKTQDSKKDGNTGIQKDKVKEVLAATIGDLSAQLDYDKLSAMVAEKIAASS